MGSTEVDFYSPPSKFSFVGADDGSVANSLLTNFCPLTGEPHMINWKKLKFPDENATADELYTILSAFLQEGLDATDAEEQRRLHIISRRLELNRRNWSAMATVIQLEIAKDEEELSRLRWNIPSITAKASQKA